MILAQAQTPRDDIEVELTGRDDAIPETSGDAILLIGVLTAVAVLIFLIAYICHRISKAPKRKRRARRRRRPTLAETGGLPPARDDSSSSTD